jgi:hypothetical protein
MLTTTDLNAEFAKLNMLRGRTPESDEARAPRRCASGPQENQPAGRFPPICAQTAEFGMAAQHSGLGR